MAMATVSKDSLAQFWLQTIRSTTIDFIPAYLPPPPPVEQSTKKFVTLNLHSLPKRFVVNVEICHEDGEEDIDDFCPLERTLDNLSSLVNSPRIIDQLQKFVSPWLIDVHFNVTNDLFSILVDLMNRHVEEFFRYCFIPWLHCPSNPVFFSNLFSHIIKPIDRNRLCTYLCENLTRPWNDNEFLLISHWLDSKEFFFSSDLFEILPDKCSKSADVFCNNLSFAKVLHKVLMKISEKNFSLTDDQRLALKQAITINTTILSDILLDLID